MDDNIIPISELRKHLSDVTKWVEKERKPMYLTKNGRGRFVMLDIQSYRELTTQAGKASSVQAPTVPPAAKPEAGFVVSPSSAPKQAPQVKTAAPQAQPRMHESLSSPLQEEEDRILKELGLL